MELHFDTDPECALIIKGILNLAPALQEIIGQSQKKETPQNVQFLKLEVFIRKREDKNSIPLH